MSELLGEGLHSVLHLTHERNGGSPMPSTGHDRAHYSTRPVRLEVVSTEAPRPLSTVEYDAHVWEIAGQGTPIGGPINIARKADRRRERVEELIGAVGIVAGAVVILYALLRLTDILVHTFWF